MRLVRRGLREASGDRVVADNAALDRLAVLQAGLRRRGRLPGQRQLNPCLAEDVIDRVQVIDAQAMPT